MFKKPEPIEAPWSVREKLRIELRNTSVSSARDPHLGEHLVDAVRRVVRRTGHRALRRLVRGRTGKPFDALMAQWVKEMPGALRADWLVARVSDAAGITWEAERQDTGEAIIFPAVERVRVTRTLTRMWERVLSRHDDEPEPAEYAEVLMREVARLGRKNERLACRALTRRFSLRGGATVGLEEMLEREGPADAEGAIRLLEEHLGLGWEGDVEASG